jgi:hypothetical protein
VEVGAQAYMLQLALVSGTDPLELSVHATEELTNASTEGASSFANNTLNVPSISYNSVSYNLQLALVGLDPITFRLESAGVNEEILSGSDSNSLLGPGDKAPTYGGICDGNRIGRHDANGVHERESDGTGYFYYCSNGVVLEEGARINYEQEGRFINYDFTSRYVKLSRTYTGGVLNGAFFDVSPSGAEKYSGGLVEREGTYKDSYEFGLLIERSIGNGAVVDEFRFQCDGNGSCVRI